MCAEQHAFWAGLYRNGLIEYPAAYTARITAKGREALAAAQQDSAATEGKRPPEPFKPDRREQRVSQPESAYLTRVELRLHRSACAAAIRSAIATCSISAVAAESRATPPAAETSLGDRCSAAKKTRLRVS